MTRRDCEAKLLSLAEEMRAVYKEYNPAGDFLFTTIGYGGYISVSDGFFTGDSEVVLGVDGYAFHTVDVTKYASGKISYGSPAREDVA